MGNLAYSEKYSINDYHLWEGEWELIYGDAYTMSLSPVYDHQFTSGKIFRQLDEGLDDCKACSATIEMD